MLVDIQYFDKARHVRAFELLWQMHVHIEHGDGVLLASGFVFDDNGVAYSLDADFINGDMACVYGILYVFYWAGGRSLCHYLSWLAFS
jgi:hypothetical protein